MYLNGPYYGIAKLFYVACIIGCSNGALKSQRTSSPAYRLPENIIPTKYSIEIITNLEDNDFYFEGRTWIRIRCVKNTNKIVLHAKELNITEREVYVKQQSTRANASTASDNNISIASQQYSGENDFYVIQLNQKLTQGNNYLVYLPFKGVLGEGLSGYYRSSYLDKMSNTTKWLAVTQFEPTDARRAFPCFDEPAMKAPFYIILIHSEKFRGTSNMPLLESKPWKEKEGWVMDKFAMTVPMSTYLVAFMVSEFDFQESEATANNVTFRIWARKEALHQVELAKQIGPRVLSFFEEYFSVPYPLPKQDMIAIPDFNAGAMENWGMITYRETALLYDEKASNFVNKYRIASVISHELAHQWFGNLVTMFWWTDLWLNEGFATYVGELGVHHVHPEWKTLNSTIVSDLLTVFSLDSLKSSHPVSTQIGHPSEIDQIFDTISYKKGSYLIRMMCSFLGEDVFRVGVSQYLSKHRYGNAAQDDLWEALTESARNSGVLDDKLSVKMIMDTWTLQTGYPLITVERDYKNGEITVSQDRYLAVAEKVEKDSDNAPCWMVPISYTTSRELNFSSTKPQAWLTCDGPITINANDLSDDQFAIFNVALSGLYRVNYDEKTWSLLRSFIREKNDYEKIDTLNRVQLIADVLELAYVAKLDYGLAFDVIGYLNHETEYLPWSAAIRGLGKIDNKLRRTPTYGLFKKFLRNLLLPMYSNVNKLTDVPEDFEGIKKHSLIISNACHYGIAECEEQAHQLFREWYTDPNPDKNNPIPKDIRSVIYCNGLKKGGEDYWDFLWERLQTSNVATEKALILASLTCTKEVWLLERYLEWSINGSYVRKQDAATVFSYVAGNDIGYFLAKEFLKKRFDDIKKYHGAKGSRMSSYIRSIGDEITTEDELNDFQKFTESKSAALVESELTLRQTLESARANIEWRSQHYESLTNYLSQL